VKWNQNVVFICFSLKAKNVEHFSCPYWQFVFLYLRTGCSVFFAIYWLDYFFGVSFF
jgi:hypothetical protein